MSTYTYITTTVWLAIPAAQAMRGDWLARGYVCGLNHAVAFKAPKSMTNSDRLRVSG